MELDQLKAREGEDIHGTEGIDYGEVFTDFATPEFLDKNVRVRPISGVTHGDDTRDGRQSNVSRSGLGGGEATMDDHQAFNAGAASDMDQQRNDIKAKFNAYQEAERKRLAAEEKKLKER